MMTQPTEAADTPRHIVSLSGGKDSTALALYMRDAHPELDLEYVFADTGEELPETMEYLDRLEAFLGQPIVRLNPDRPFRHYLRMYGDMLPDARTRWCTKMLKIRPFERYIGDDQCYNYIGIRADEDREGYISTKPNITPKYPFVEDGIRKRDVMRILDDAGLGLPAYYEWRSRSGCYFCFFQRRIEWVGLLENHPDKFEEAKKIEEQCGEGFTWVERESLAKLSGPERVKEIREEFEQWMQRQKERRAHLTLFEVLQEEDEQDDQACLICRL